MGYFNGLVNASFKKGELGRTVFYPYGMLGYGYILSQDSERRIKSFLKRFAIICLPIAILVGTLFKLYGIVLLIIFIPIYSFRIRNLLATATKTEKKNNS